MQRQQYCPIFTATPHGVMMDGASLTKSASRNLSVEIIREIEAIEKLIEQVKKEEWDKPILYDGGKYPLVVLAKMRAVLLSPQPFLPIPSKSLAKAGFNPDEPRDERGRWTDSDGDPGKLEETRVSGYEEVAYNRNKPEPTHDFYIQRKQNFVNAHLAATERVAKELNVPVENILGIAALESQWGDYHFASEGNNFFGLYYPAPYGVPNQWNTARGNPKARLAVFNSYEDSLNSFIYSNGSLIQGKSDPVAFMQSLQDSGKFGINTNTGEPMPTYVRDAAATIRGLRSVIAQTRARAGKK